ncbi:MAG TPA: TetR/AcrR family transcriptional regulator [Bacillota bacterium]|nr:TetR/AcrR family transcriptional regulator [Bacillota bacterium]
MDEKKKHVLACGVRLFAQKGYHKTSIEEIAKEAGISKGAFYLYFSSKESFVVAALTMFQTEINEQIAHVQQEPLDPRESLSKQMTYMIEHMYTYKDFLLMYIQEDISIGEETLELVQQMKQSNVQWLYERIHNVYGKNVEKIIYDVIVILEGIFAGYMRWAIIEQAPINYNDIGPFMVERLDDIVEAMIAKNTEPLLKEFPKVLHVQGSEWRDIDLKETIQTLKMIDIPEDANTAEVVDVLEILENELYKEHMQPAIIRGLLTQLRTFKEYKSICDTITRKLELEHISK